MGDDELLARARSDPDAYAAFYRRHARPLAAFFHRRTHDAEAAADLTAETFAAALAALHRYDPERGSGSQWLYGVARRELATYLERGAVEQRARRRMGIAPIALDDEALEQVEHAAATSALLPEAEALLAKLPPDQRAAVRARVIEEQDYDDIAAAKRVSEPAVRPRVPLPAAAPRLVAALAIALIAVVVVAGALRTRGGGGEGEEAASGPAAPTAPTAGITDLRAAARAADCDVRLGLRDEGRDHAARRFSPDDYGTNPPTSGPHGPDWYPDGVYAPGATPDLGKLVHALEHGRIHVQYRDRSAREPLEALLAETDGYHQLLTANSTAMPYAVAATAWRRMLGCPRASPEAMDALRAFRAEYVDRGPERVP